ncbi:DDT domain-containing protein DDB_G0282237-like [Triticum dicoccoides]|uniref:DDT domain-containing protein DDB_G0282237-like n=1 Tax=Triticum dicoccoides TaxID=85692 RepID=UPI000E7C88BF|nr:DDT domain-containing protein DDB_G0282237-like [Triticum dicoccoides]XP_037485704.1 DDT domain-containing protein DDB_G0282237-like [Triticum dicoccoides]
MPLFKRTPFFLLDPPKDLDPKEKVFQVRFTKEIFRDYQEYLNRLNLYRRRVWTCKVSGKSNLTYEEALVSEQRAAEKAQQLPRELMSPVLQMIQYSTLSLTDLVNKIYGSLQENLFEGLELHAKRDGLEAACKILKVIGSGETTSYEVGWIGQDNAITSTSVLRADDLIRKKAPCGRNMLKIFIRESTSQNSPWIVHMNLAKKYGIPTEPPKDMINGEGLSKARKRLANGTAEDASKRSKKDEEEQVVPVKYPIDDLLVKPVADDPVLSKRCPPSTDFKVPISSVGDLLMVWDFCMSFGRLLCLSPFSLSDLENAICHKETNLVLLVEIHTALLNLLINDEGEYFEFIQDKNRKSKVSLVTWKEYLCDFMEMTSISSNISTVRRGHYGLVPTSLKLEILRELVDEAIATIAVKEKLDERIDQQQALAAEKREIARKNKEEQKLIMEVATEKEMNQTNAVQDGNENVNGQLVAKEGKERKNTPASKMGDAKLHLGRHLEKELLDQSVRTSPLGKDRFYNRYWFFKREGRLFVESADSKEWGYYSTKEELDALIGSLNIKGIRERALKQQLDKFYNKISIAVEKRLKEVTHQLLVEEAVLRRSSRVHAHPKDSPSTSFLEYVNTWKPITKRNKSKEDRAT